MSHRERLYQQWRERLQCAHKETLKEFFGESTLPLYDEDIRGLSKVFDAALEHVLQEETLKELLTPTERLRLWRLDHVNLSPGGREKLLEHVVEFLEEH